MISLPTPFYPDKTINDEDMIARLTTGVKTLNDVLVDFIVIPCNIVHKYHNIMQAISTVPILNIIDITINEIKLMQANTVGLIATSATINSNLYQEQLYANKIKLFHTNKLQLKITELLIELKLFKLSSKSISLWNEIISYLELGNCTHSIIACTDISICKDLKQTNIQFIDSNDILAKKTITKYIEFKKLDSIKY
ncbi:MAG: aspartate/glutamate racemase family protein [Rickettsiaceae bacterium]|nr:aspartate/glutamate racemase family protein [Rickettsiaceae bacterium]